MQISTYETKQSPYEYDPAPGVGILFFDIWICALSFDIYLQYMNGTIVVILCAIHPRSPQEYLAKMSIFLLKDSGSRV